MNELVNLAQTHKASYYPNNSRTIVTPNKLEAIVSLSKDFSCVEGEIAEVGVWRGGVGLLFGKLFENTNKKIYLFDTFEGIPFSNEKDNKHRPGDFGPNDGQHFTDFEEVKTTCSIYPNISLYKGIFPKETSSVIENVKFSIVHLDVDVYQSYKESYEFFYSRMTPGGIIFIDDYNVSSCEGCTIATNEFLQEKTITLQERNGQYYFVV